MACRAVSGNNANHAVAKYENLVGKVFDDLDKCEEKEANDKLVRM